MTNEEKQLLLKDLCARLPYGVICTFNGGRDKVKLWAVKPYYDHCVELLCGSDNQPNACRVECVKPYLRPMSSMTEEEMEELNKLSSGVVWRKDILHDVVLDIWYNTDSIDWLNAHHFDYRGLIKKGLALEAPEGMYVSL